jgi:cytochrome b561
MREASPRGDPDSPLGDRPGSALNPTAKFRAKGYSRLQILLHWTMAALIIFQLLVNRGMQDAFDDMMDGDRIDSGYWAALHIAVGLAVLALAIVRVAIRLRRGASPPDPDHPVVLVWLSMATHLALYGFIFLIPLTGAFAWFGRSEISAEVHEWARLLLIPLILLHAVGAFVEQFVFHNGTITRMVVPTHKSD